MFVAWAFFRWCDMAHLKALENSIYMQRNSFQLGLWDIRLEVAASLRNKLQRNTRQVKMSNLPTRKNSHCRLVGHHWKINSHPCKLLRVQSIINVENILVSILTIFPQKIMANHCQLPNLCNVTVRHWDFAKSWQASVRCRSAYKFQDTCRIRSIVFWAHIQLLAIEITPQST